MTGRYPVMLMAAAALALAGCSGATPDAGPASPTPDVGLQAT